MICFLHKLDDNLINLIKEYIPIQRFVCTNRENFKAHHHHIKPFIKNYANYIFNTILRDNEFVFNEIIRENFYDWSEIVLPQYKNIIFKNYVYLINYYCFENGSRQCELIMSLFLREHGLDKNLHKKNTHKYIRWTK